MQDDTTTLKQFNMKKQNKPSPVMYAGFVILPNPNRNSINKYLILKDGHIKDEASSIEAAKYTINGICCYRGD